MTAPEVFINGRFVPADEAVVSVFDRGFRTGEGVFETFRSYTGYVFRLDAHLDRAFAGAEVLGFDPGPRERIAEAVRAVADRSLDALGGGDAVVRLTLTPGSISPTSPFPGDPVGAPTVVVSAHPLEIDPAVHHRGVKVMSVPLARELPHVKALSYLAASLARAEARRAGAAEALLVDGLGRVLEGAGSNVFAMVDGVLVTPPVRDGLLPGVTRAVVIELAPELGLEVHEDPLPIDGFGRFDEVFLTATTREVVPVVEVDGTAIADGLPGTVVRRLHAAYRQRVEDERNSRD